MNSVAELKAHLETQNLFASYISGELPEMFEGLTTASGIDSQNSFRTLQYDAKFWISYNQYADQFTFCVSYFDHNGNAISKATFAEALAHLPAAQYDETNERNWVRDGSLYRLQPISNAVIKLGIKTIIPR
jgi:hypothetical protein